MKRYISSLLVFVMLFSLFSPIIEATENGILEDIYNEESYIQTSENVVATIPEDSDSLRSDLGIESLIADIKSFNTFSLKKSRTNTVEIDVSSLDSSNLDVLHFIENVDAITEDMGIVDISDYSDDSKSVLASAINAYQEKYNSDKECVVVEIFEDLPVENGNITFDVESFSIFAIGDFDINIYEFYVDGALHNIQVLIGNDDGEDILVSPETPYKDDNEFLGWQVEGETDYIEFGSISVNPSKDTIKVNAVFDEVSYVYFYYEAKENADILETLSGKNGDTIYTDKVDYPINLDKHVISWHTDINCTSEEITSVKIESQNIILYPKVKTGYWVTFYTEGGSYIDSMFYATDDSILAPENPTKTGSKFAGWMDENGNEFVFNNQILNKSTILTAKWEPQIVNYTVQLVAQSTTNTEQYNPVASGLFTKEALVGTTITGNTITQDEIDLCIENLASNAELKEFLECFKLNTTKTNNESIVVQADGSSVIYVYYDRYPFVFNFYIDDETIHTTYTKLFNAEITMEEWPILTEEEYSGFSSWLLYDDRNTVIARLDAYSLDNVVFDGEKYILNLVAYGSQTTNWKAYYYFQSINPDGTVPDVGYTLEEHVQYIESVDLLNPDNPLNAGNEAIKNNWTTAEVDSELGVTSDVTVNGNWILEDIFEYGSSYPAVTYSADAYSGFTPIAFMGDYYENIDGTNSVHKGPYIRVPEWDYYGSSTKLLRFRGYVDGKYTSKYYDGSNPLESGKWYLTSDAVQITFKGHLYIRYLRNHYDLVFKVGNEIIDEFEVYYETDLGLDKFKIPETKLNAPLGYKFGGWFTSETYSEDTRFELDNHTMPANDLVLYAKWVPTNVELDVHITIDGVDAIIEGFNGFTVKYGDTVSREQVNLLKPNVQMPEDAIWYGWYEKVDVGGTEPLMVPFNFDKQLVEDIVLYPFYSYMTPVNVTYDLNGGTGTAPVDNFNYALGRGAVVLDNKNVIPPDGKVFVYWNTESDGSGKSYYPADIALINNDSMSLYAIYENDIGTEKVDLTYVNTVTNEEKTFEYDKTEKVMLKTNFVFDIATSLKYIFKGWNTKSDGSGTSYQPNDWVYLTEKGNKLYTVFEEDPRYDRTLMYVNTLNNEEVSEYYTKTTLVSLKGENVFKNPVHEKYIFKKWNTKPDGSGKDYSAGTLIEMGLFDVVAKFYAIWDVDPDYKLVINYINPNDNEEVQLEYPGENSATIKDETVFSNDNSKYVFKGCNTNKNGMGASYNAGETLEYLGEIDLYAMWEIDPNYELNISYVNPITSETKDSTYLGVDSFTVADKTIFSNPTPDKYVFKEWNTKADGSGTKFNPNATIKDSDMVNNEIVLYAIWDEKIFITYVNPITLEEKTVEYLPSDTITVSDASIFDTATDSKYKFINWSTAVDNTGVDYNVGDTLSSNITLYAVWKEEINIVYINTLNSEEVIDKYYVGDTIKVKDKTVFVNPIDSKYYFKQWNTEADGSGTVYYENDNLSGSITLYALWEEERIITYINPLNAEEKEFKYTPFEMRVVKDETVFNNSVDPKYYFNGWNTKADGTGTPYNYLDIITIKENVTLYAIWGEKVCIIYKNPLNGEEKVDKYMPSDSISVKEPSIFDIAVDSKYEFKEWNTELDGSGTSYKVNDTLTENTVLYAVWDVPFYITYVNTFDSDTVTEKHYSDILNSVPVKGDVFSSVDYELVGWNTESDGSGTNYAIGAPLTSTITLYTVWSPKIVVTYINTLTSEEVVEKYLSSDTITVKDTNVFVNPVDSKYEFKGWNTAADNSGSAYNISDSLTGNITLYAIYKEKVIPSRPSNPTPTNYTYTIYYKDENGNDISEKFVGKGKLNELIIAECKDIEGFVCTDVKQTITITKNSKDNIIVFEYVKEYKIPNHKYLDYSLNHKLYIVGYEDGTVRPENNITRAESATIFYRLLKDDIQKQFRTNSNKFTDVNENAWFNTSVSTLTNMGIIGGYSDNTFRPNQYITRAEFITLMVGFFDTDTKVGNNQFSDVFESDWYYKSVIVGVDKGFIAGYPDGTFKPNQYITRAEACKIVNKVLDRRPTKPGLYDNLIDWPDLNDNAWYYLDVMEATHGHIADYNHFKNNLENWNKQ